MHRVIVQLCCIISLLALPVAAQKTGRTFNVIVEAGNFDRQDSVVTFTLPPGLNSEVMVLREGANEVRWQPGKDGKAAVTIHELKKGAVATFTLLEAGGKEGQVRRENHSVGVTVSRAGEKVDFSFSEPDHKARLLFSYQAEPGALPREDIKPEFRRGGYLHPIRTPSGKVVTDDFPPNHIHHHGVWWAWTHTEFDGRTPDFWNMGDGKGRVEFVSLDETWSGPVHGGFRSKHRFIDLTSGKPVNALNESWKVTAYAAPAAATYWMFDLVSEQLCATTNELKLPLYRYGGVGLRGNWAWNGKDKAAFLTSDGETDREKGHATCGRWCYMGGELDGGPAGVAILCHPENFRAPQPMRLHPTEPFFNFAPQQAGDMEIKPGETYLSRYRFVVLDGGPVKAGLDRLWNDYAHPPVVKIVER